MKTNFFKIILFFIVSSTYCQDIIVKNDKTEIKAKIEEITETTIKYKKFEMLEGPIYNINVKDVFMIIYKNGSKEYINQVNSKTQVSEKSNSESPKSNNLEKLEESMNSSNPKTDGSFPKLVKFTKNSYLYEGVDVVRNKDFIKIYNKFGYQDLTKKVKTGTVVSFCVMGTGAIVSGIAGGLLVSNMVYNSDRYIAPGIELKEKPTTVYAVLTGLGIGSIISGFTWRNLAVHKTAYEFNKRMDSKVSQSVKLTPSFYIDPITKGAQIGINVGF